MIKKNKMKKLLLILICVNLFSCVYKTSNIQLRKLPPVLIEEIPEIHQRNIFVILINNNDEILYGIGYPTNNIEINSDGLISSSLKEDVKSFIKNNGVKDNSSESPEKAIVSLQNQKGASYAVYLLVQTELSKVYNELRNEKANNDFGRDFDKLDVEEQKIIKKYFPMKISETEIKKTPKNR